MKEDQAIVKYKHLRDEDGVLCGTVCFCTDPINPKKVYIGVAICAEGDNFSRKIGRTISFGRAERAFYEGINTLPITTTWERDRVDMVYEMLPILQDFPYKSICYTHK
jgi:hypothetical protein